MATRLFVGNLPYSVSEDRLRALFSEAGTVQSLSCPTERGTGRPRGFCFVDMANSDEAERATRMFNGYRIDDRTLRVETASERPPRPSGERRRTSGEGRYRY